MIIIMKLKCTHNVNFSQLHNLIHLTLRNLCFKLCEIKIKNIYK